MSDGQPETTLPSPDVEGLREAAHSLDVTLSTMAGIASPYPLTLWRDHCDAALKLIAALPALLAIAEENGRRDAVAREQWGDQEDEHSPAIEAAHPVNSSDPDRHKRFDRALSMIGTRRGKYELVGLANWLLARAEKAEAEAAELTAQLDALAFADARVARVVAAEAEAAALRGALEEIAEGVDVGRHDGLPEDGPAHDAETMFALARSALNPTKENG